MIPVVLDTDIGTDIDDTWALALLLGCPEVDLRLVVTATGDTVYRAQIVAGLLQAARRTDISIGLGVPTTLPTHIPAHPQRRHAQAAALDCHGGGVQIDGVTALIESVMSSDELVTIVAIGPQTNLAAAVEKEPEIARRSRVVAMLGSVHAGCFTRSAVPEYNVAIDVPACRMALNAGWDLTIAPLDTCGSVVLRGADYALVRDVDSPLMSAVLSNYEEWFADWSVAGAPWSETFDRIDARFAPVSDDATAKRANEQPFWQRSSTILFDAVAVYLAYDESFLNIEQLPLSIDDDGLMRITPGAAEVRVATSWRDRDQFMSHLAERLRRSPCNTATQSS